MNNLKTIVLSTGNSGGGAIFEYLKSRKDFLSPFKNEEYRMVADPDGLYDLYSSLYKNKSIYSSSLAITRFLNYNKRLQNLKVFSKNKKIKLCAAGYDKIINDFLKQITFIKYFSNPQFFRMKLDNLDKIKIYLNEKLNGTFKSHRPFEIIIPTTEKNFMSCSNLMLNKIILNNLKKKKVDKNIVIDQGANIINPLESSVFYGNRKIIIVNRDPKAIFASMKRRKSFAYPGYDINIFVNWYKWMANNIEKNKSKLILRINFEDFILNRYKNISRIEKFLKIKTEKNLLFNFEKSEKNLYKALKILSKSEIKYINKNLKKYLIW